MKQDFYDVLKWINEYYNSPAFEELLRRHNNVKRFSLKTAPSKQGNLDSFAQIGGMLGQLVAGNKPKDYMFEKSPNLAIDGSGFKTAPMIGGMYDPNTQVITLGTQKDGSAYSWKDIIAHEMGHAIENSLKPVVVGSNVKPSNIQGYSETYPIFRNNKLFEREYLLSPYEKVRRTMIKHPNEMMSHDARPAESYADLIQLRHELSNLGIYDSRKEIGTFDANHLKQYKKSAKQLNRLFKYFDDSDIINMLNTVAKNTDTNRYTYYG